MKYVQCFVVRIPFNIRPTKQQIETARNYLDNAISDLQKSIPNYEVVITGTIPICDDCNKEFIKVRPYQGGNFYWRCESCGDTLTMEERKWLN